MDIDACRWGGGKNEAFLGDGWRWGLIMLVLMLGFWDINCGEGVGGLILRLILG